MVREWLVLIAGAVVVGFGVPWTARAVDAPPRVDVMSNGILEVRYARSNNTMKVTDARNGRIYVQAGYPADEGAVVNPVAGVLPIDVRIKGMAVRVTVSLPADAPSEVRVTLSAPGETKMPSDMGFPSRFQSRPGEFLLIPRGEGQLWPVEDKAFGGWWHTDLAFTGSVDLGTGTGYQMIYDTPFDARTDVSLYKGLMTVAPMWQPSKGTLGYDRTLSYRFYDKGGYVAMAKDYKARTKPLGYQVPFTEKAKTRPNLLRLKGAVDMWPMSPDVKNADFMRTLRLLGIRRAVISLGTGWEGPQGVGDLIDFANSKGFLTSRYDIYTDIWNAADNPPAWARLNGFPEDIIKGPKGEMQKGWVIREDGKQYQGYYACSVTHAAEAQKRVGEDLADNRYNARFIDVTTASSLYECHDPAHPTTREEDARARVRLLSMMSREFGLVTGSEQSREWAMGVTDFGEGTMSVRSTDNSGYDWMTPEKATPVYLRENADGARRVPLVGLVYHEGHMSTWYTGDGYQKVPEAWGSKELLDILYGSMPLWMFDGDLWREYQDKFVSAYQNVNSVFGAVAFDELTDHRFLTPDGKVQATSFSSGVRVEGNFGEAPWKATLAVTGCEYAIDDELVLDKEGFLAVGPGLFAFRGMYMGAPVNYVRTRDRVFLDPRGRGWGIGCIDSDHMVLLHGETDLAVSDSAYLVVYGGDGGNAGNAGNGGVTARVTLRPDSMEGKWRKGVSDAFVLNEYGNAAGRASVGRQPGGVTIDVPVTPGEFTVVRLVSAK